LSLLSGLGHRGAPASGWFFVTLEQLVELLDDAFEGLALPHALIDLVRVHLEQVLVLAQELVEEEVLLLEPHLQLDVKHVLVQLLAGVSEHLHVLIVLLLALFYSQQALSVGSELGS